MKEFVFLLGVIFFVFVMTLIKALRMRWFSSENEDILEDVLSDTDESYPE